MILETHKFPDKDIADLQETINLMKVHPQFNQYITEHKLKLLDAKFEIVDLFLDLNILKD